MSRPLYSIGNWLTDVGEVAASRAGLTLPPRKIPSTNLCFKLSQPQGHNAAEIILMNDFNELIVIRKLDLPAYSTVPQRTALERTTKLKCIKLWGRYPHN
jgi:hypothetical protein